MATTVCLLNQKGGVGKTSTCYHLGGTMAKLGRRVLLIDNDPQASLSQGFFGPEGTAAIPVDATIAASYDVDAEPIPSTLVQPTGIDGLAIMPGSTSLASYNMVPVDSWGRSLEGLRTVTSDPEIAEGFDLILIDCPPNLHLCSAAALVAADAIVIPLQAEDFGAQGLGPVRAAVASIREGANPALQLAGYLITMYDRRLGIHLAYEAKLREMFGADVFGTPFPLAKDFKEAVAARQPISHYRPRSAAAKAAKVVGEELLERLASRVELAKLTSQGERSEKADGEAADRRVA
jgi:chromosome partitioning protein